MKPNRSAIFSFACALALLALGCDSAEGEGEELLRVSVVDEQGEPVPDVDVYLAFQFGPGSGSGTGGDIPGLRVSSPYPNPLGSRTSIRIDAEEDTGVVVRVESMDGEVVGQLYDDFLNAGQIAEVMWRPDSELPPGIYAFHVTADGGTSRRYALLHRGPADALELLAGTTGSDGVVATSDSLAMPFLYDVDSMDRTDELGTSLGTFRLTEEVVIRLVGWFGAEQEYVRFLNASGNDLDLTFGP